MGEREDLKSSSGSLHQSTTHLWIGHCFVPPVKSLAAFNWLGVDLYLPRSIPRPYSLPRPSRSRSHTWRWSGCPGSSAGRPQCPSGSPPRGSGGWGRGPDGDNVSFKWPWRGRRCATWRWESMKDVFYVLHFCKRHSEQDHKSTLGGECEARGVMLGSERLRGSNGVGGAIVL